MKDSREGLGTYHYFNGDRYEGEWHGHVRHGRGVYLYARKQRVYQGTWVDNVKQPGGELASSFISRIPHEDLFL